MSKLIKKRVLITAGAQGIGLAISRHFIAAGCDLAVHYHSSEAPARRLAIEATDAGLVCGALGADLTSAEECDRLVKAAAQLLGGIDVLVNNAGSLVARRKLDAADDDFWAEVMSLNLGSARRVTRAALPFLTAAAKERGGASIVNLSSLAGRKGGGPGAIAYSTAKGAILTFTRGLAMELGPLGIRANAVAPGLILGSRFHATHTSEESVKQIVAGIPLGRAGNVDDVARAVVYLAGEWDGFVTGATLDINGGVYCA